MDCSPWVTGKSPMLRSHNSDALKPTHKEAQELARHATPGLTSNRYARTRNERLAGITEKIAERVLSGKN